eukprot:gene19535-23402_t
MTSQQEDTIAVLGCGNIGLAIAEGLVNSKLYKSTNVIVTKRHVAALESLAKKGFTVTSSNTDAVSKASVIIVCVTPAQLDHLLDDIAQSINPATHTVISVVSGASIEDFQRKIGTEVAVVRAMPNTAIAHCQSMTCLAVRSGSAPLATAEVEARKNKALAISERIFNVLGTCIVLKEEQIVPATALCACGIAFFCRAIRAAAQGGIEIGFHAEDAIKIAAQTAKGAATLLLEGGFHPEFEIDKVTTPQGCTIAGLNQMEHSGFSSAMIKGIVTSAEKAASLYNSKRLAQQHQQQQQQFIQQIASIPVPLAASQPSAAAASGGGQQNSEKKKRAKKPRKPRGGEDGSVDQSSSTTTSTTEAGTKEENVKQV